MIRGLHGLFYTSEPDEMRAFLRDKMKLPHTDVGQGWLIFDLPEADLGVHPVDESGRPPTGTHDISFFCDDIQGTVAGMRERGVVFRDEIQDHGYGLVTHFTAPGEVIVQLYEPRYTKGSAKKAAKPKAKVAKAKSKPKAKAKAKAPAKKKTPARRKR
jgi:hypothetical protein